MKASRLSCIVFCSALLLCIPTFAGNTNKKSLHLNEVVTVHGVQLAPGDYRVEWSEPGPNVQLSILRGKDTLATVAARVVQGNTPNEQDGYALKPGKNGSQSLTDIFFSGQRYDLEIGQASNAKPASTTSRGSSD